MVKDNTHTMNFIQYLISLSLIVGFAFIVKNVNWKGEIGEIIAFLKAKKVGE